MRFEGQRDPWSCFPGDAQSQAGSGPWTGLPVQRRAVTKRPTSAPAHIKRLRTIRNAALVGGWWEEVGALGENTETQTDISIDIHTFTKCSSRGAILTKKKKVSFFSVH